jgi:hypothetical protein
MAEGMSKVEAVRLAVAEIGEASPQDIAAFVEQRFALKVQPRFVPVLLASLRGQEHLQRTRQSAKRALRQARAEQASAAPVNAKKPRKKKGSAQEVEGAVAPREKANGGEASQAEG